MFTGFHLVAGYSSSSGSSGSEFSGFMMSGKDKEAVEVEGSEGSGSRRMWGTRVAKFLSSCSGNLGSSGMSPCVDAQRGMMIWWHQTS